jgi:uncharacterized membrane protein
LFAAAALALNLLLVWADTTISICDSELLSRLCAGDAEGARQLLIVAGGSMLTVADVVISVAIVVLSMASAQSRPKLLRNYMHDRGNQIVLGVFIADVWAIINVVHSNESTGANVVWVGVNLLLPLLGLIGCLIFGPPHHASLNECARRRSVTAPTAAVDAAYPPWSLPPGSD